MSTYTSTSGVGGILPEAWGPLLVEPVQQAAVCLNPLVSTVVTTEAHTFHLPVVNSDAAANWVAEGAEIVPSDPTLSELKITPSKVAALSIISRELADDSTPAAQQMVGQGMARSIAAQLDSAFFGSLAAPAPAGLGSLTNASVSRIAIGASPSNLDGFASAIAAVEQDGAEITSFVASPADALTIQTLKVATGNNSPLLGIDATNGTARQVLGIPLLVSPKISPGTIWGLSASRNVVVLREDVSVDVDRSVFFTSDRVAVRGTMRAGFGFPTPKAVAKLALAAS